jgi:hypothetical protein
VGKDDDVMADKEEVIKEYTSYNTNLTPKDIVLSFPGNVINYLSKSRFYLCDYTVYQGESEQSYAWSFKVIKNSYKWGTIYTLQLFISNGSFYIETSTSNFTSGDRSAEHVSFDALDKYKMSKSKVCESIVREFKSFVQESLITLKRYNKNYDMESQEAFAYVCTEFLPELLSNRKGEHEGKRKGIEKQ